MSLAAGTAGASARTASSLRRLAHSSPRSPSRTLRSLSVLTAVNTYAVIVIGGVVRVTGSGLGCDAPGDNGWPLCRGALLPPLQQQAIIEFSHRWLVASLSGLLLALVATVLLRYRHQRRLVAGVVAVVALLAVQIALGQLTVQHKLPGSIVMVHLANAELLLGVLLWTVLLTFVPAAPARAAVGDDRAAQVAVRRLALAAAGVYLLVLSGALVVAEGAGYACEGWPLCGGGLRLDSSQLAIYNASHRAVAGAVGLLVAVALLGAWRVRRSHAAVRPLVGVAITLLLAQGAAGAILVETRLPAAARSLHEALASAVWAVVILLFLLLRQIAAVTADAEPRGSAVRARALPIRTAAP